MSDKSFCKEVFEFFLWSGSCAALGFAIARLIVKSIEHDDEIEELFSRLEECEKDHESSQDS